MIICDNLALLNLTSHQQLSLPGGLRGIDISVRGVEQVVQPAAGGSLPGQPATDAGLPEGRR